MAKVTGLRSGSLLRKQPTLLYSNGDCYMQCRDFVGCSCEGGRGDLCNINNIS